jgi:hypothetical protein
MSLYVVDPNTGKKLPIDMEEKVSELMSEYWNGLVGIFLEKVSTKRILRSTIITDDEISDCEDGNICQLDYEGFPPYIKFIGTTGRIIIKYSKKYSNMRSTLPMITLKGSMCKNNLINPISSDTLQREVLVSSNTNPGIFLEPAETKDFAYVFIKNKV